MVQECPKCGLVNPPTAQRYDRGYDFASRTMQESYMGAGQSQALQSPSTIEVLVCIFMPCIGFVLGLLARGRGRPRAGNRMLLISAVAAVVGIGLRLLYSLAK
jgi:hypothetical protein